MSNLSLGNYYFENAQPIDIFNTIISHLPPEQQAKAREVNHYWRDAINELFHKQEFQILKALEGTEFKEEWNKIKTLLSQLKKPSNLEKVKANHAIQKEINAEIFQIFKKAYLKNLPCYNQEIKEITEKLFFNIPLPVAKRMANGYENYDQAYTLWSGVSKALPRIGQLEVDEAIKFCDNNDAKLAMIKYHLDHGNNAATQFQWGFLSEGDFESFSDTIKYLDQTVLDDPQSQEEFAEQIKHLRFYLSNGHLLKPEDIKFLKELITKTMKDPNLMEKRDQMLSELDVKNEKYVAQLIESESFEYLYNLLEHNWPLFHPSGNEQEKQALLARLFEENIKCHLNHHPLDSIVRIMKSFLPDSSKKLIGNYILIAINEYFKKEFTYYCGRGVSTLFSDSFGMTDLDKQTRVLNIFKTKQEPKIPNEFDRYPVRRFLIKYYMIQLDYIKHMIDSYITLPELQSEKKALLNQISSYQDKLEPKGLWEKWFGKNKA